MGDGNITFAGTPVALDIGRLQNVGEIVGAYSDVPMICEFKSAVLVRHVELMGWSVSKFSKTQICKCEKMVIWLIILIELHDCSLNSLFKVLN